MFIINSMSLKEKQKEVDEWVKEHAGGYWPALEQMARLSEETGEVARELNHIHGTKKKKGSEETKELADELVDVIFTAICLANSHNIDLEEAWKKVMKEKHYGRDIDRYKKE